MQNDMIKLNTLLNKEKGTHDNLHQDNILLENDFIMALKVSSQSLLKLWYTVDSYVVHTLLNSSFGCLIIFQEAEMESIELQANLDGIKEEKERLLNSLVEAE